MSTQTTTIQLDRKPISNSDDKIEADWANGKPKLRRDLRIYERKVQGRSVVVIEDPVSGKFVQIGMREYSLLRLLDGKTTIVEANERLASVEPDANGESQIATHSPFVTVKLQELLYWFLKNNLVATNATVHSDRVIRSSKAQVPQRVIKWIAPFYFRIPLCHPDRSIQKLAPIGRAIFSYWGFILWILLVGFAISRFATVSDAFFLASRHLIADYNWIWLLVAGIGLKVVHETGHALACRRYGAEVREAGVAVMCFAPLAFVDVTSSWRLSNRWHRIVISTAGIYFELAVAAIALIVWSYVANPVIQNVCYRIIFMATMTTVLFNANPLMRFDGYFILSDVFDTPNLYQRASELLRRSFSSLFTKNRLPSISTKSAAMLGYGLAAFIYRILICIGIVLVAAFMFYGVGLVFSISAIAIWCGLPIFQAAKSFWNHRSHFSWQRTVVSGTLIVALGLAFGAWLLAPATIVAPGIVEYEPLTVIRAKTDGFVISLPKLDGERVQQGELIATLQNDDLELELARTRLEWVQAKIRQDDFELRGEVSQSQAEEKNVKNLEEQIADLQRQKDDLHIVAERDGFIVTRNVDELIGRYFNVGDEILLLGIDAKEMKFSVAQTDVVALTDNHKADVSVLAGGKRIQNSSIAQISPRGSTQPLHHSLCAGKGGNIPVRMISATESAGTNDTLRLLTPRFTISIPVDAMDTYDLRAGERVWLRVKSDGKSRAEKWYEAIHQWWINRTSVN